LINIRDLKEIQKIKQSCEIVRDTLKFLEPKIEPGISTLSLDKIAEEFIRSRNALPGFKGLYGFPATLCVSIDDEVVHGIPGKRILEEGQIVSLDVGAIVDGYYGDHARSFPVGEVSADKQKLMDVTKKSLSLGIEAAKPGNHIGDIGYAIQSYVESFGYGIVRELVGHGIGTKLHEEPQIPNYGIPNNGPIIKVGMCFAIEPMVTLKSYQIFTKEDQWTICTVDGLPSAHFEHTITVTEDGAEILTI